MKLDTEHMHDYSTPVHKPVPKYLVNPFEMGDLHSENLIFMEDEFRMPCDVKNQNSLKDVEQLPNEKANDDNMRKIPILNSVERDELINGRGCKIENCVAPCTISSNEVELFGKGGECYTDKTVMECEVPEKLSFFKVDACHVVKDICVDEGVPSLDKTILEHCQGDLDFTEVSKKTADYPSLMSDEMKSLIGHHHNMDVSNQCDSKSLVQQSKENNAEDDTSHNEINSLNEHNLGEEVNMLCCSNNQFQKEEAIIDTKDEIPHDKGEGVVTKDMLLSENQEKENSHPELLQCDKGQTCCGQDQLCSLLQKNGENVYADDEIKKGVSDDIVTLSALLLQEVNVQNSDPASSNFSCNEDQEQSKQEEISKEPFAAHHAVCSVAEESCESNCINNSAFDGKVESGSIAYNFVSPTTSSREGSPQKVDNQNCLHAQPGGLEDGTLDSLTNSSRGFFIQHGYGESSFSAVGPPSGSILHSGPVPNSGSVSHRSDSSTTSTRSFAFPVLNPEWNSSPVKMAKADQGLFRKYRSCMLNLFCCRF